MKSHGTGLPPWEFAQRGEDVVLEEGVLIFHPENIFLGDDIYVGHQAILKGYYRNEMHIGSGSWIGQQVFIHSAAGLVIGEHVGIGPGVKIVTSTHKFERADMPIMHQDIEFSPVAIGAGSDIGMGAMILPGVTLGEGCQVGAGAVVTQSFPAHSVVAGVPARLIRSIN